MDACSGSVEQHCSELQTHEASNVPCVDYLLSTSASKLVSITGIATSADLTPVSASIFDEESGSYSKQKTSSLSTVASMLSRRSHPAFPVCHGENSSTVASLRDVRKFVFQATSRGDKRIVGGLRAHSFTSQAFISSFAVGLAIGSILAIIVKILCEVSYRLFHFQI
jgi:hypothetical protein